MVSSKSRRNRSTCCCRGKDAGASLPPGSLWSSCCRAYFKSPKPEGLTCPADGGRRDEQGFGQILRLAADDPLGMIKQVVQHPLFQGTQVLPLRHPPFQQMPHPRSRSPMMILV